MYHLFLYRPDYQYYYDSGSVSDFDYCHCDNINEVKDILARIAKQNIENSKNGMYAAIEITIMEDHYIVYSDSQSVYYSASQYQYDEVEWDKKVKKYKEMVEESRKVVKI